MGGDTEKSTRYHFGPFTLDSGLGALFRSGTRVKLQDLPFRLLAMLENSRVKYSHPRRSSLQVVAREHIR